jgi:uroporphyrinogen III methyltransferase/synthase
VIVIGEVMKVTKTSRKIAAFRPENSLLRSKEIAERYGFEFFGFPLFELVERREALNEIKDVFESGIDLVVFTSANGVKKSFRICEAETDFDFKERLSTVEICAIGPVTRKELERRGLKVDLMPAEYSTDGLKRMFDPIGGVKNRKIIFLRSAEGGKDIVEYLRRRGAFVKDIAVYKVEMKDSKEENGFFAYLTSYNPDYIIFTSSLTAKIFFELAIRFKMKDEVVEVLSDAKIVAIGDLTAEAIREREEGIKVDMVARESTFEGALKEIKRSVFV